MKRQKTERGYSQDKNEAHIEHLVVKLQKTVLDEVKNGPSNYLLYSKEVHQQLYKKFVIMLPNTIEDPHAMVIHPLNAPLAD
mmetsp:Transcript_27888/g.69938  ORF Transcript_27888/g.69938 Transcript_27888/m.69938 type:complete len:82 (+) Transcript_27888:210-455(+)